MSSSLADSFEHNGFTVEIHYDMDGSASNPRDNCNNGLFLGFPNRSYNIGDEQVDPNNWEIDCKACKGEGAFTFPVMGEEVSRDCDPCWGTGRVAVQSFDDLCEYVRANWNVVGPILPVAMYEHSGVSYSIGTSGGDWDTSDAGVIFATRELLDETQGKDGAPTDDELREWLKSEIEEYSRWANGEVYGYVIKDINDDTIDSCWGFIGDEYVTESAKEAVPNVDEMPAKLYSLQLTEVQLTTVKTALMWCVDQPSWAKQVDQLQSPLTVVDEALPERQKS